MGCGSSKVDVEDVNYVKNVKAKYVLGDLLGEGASCSVVKATDTNGDKHYAVKMLERKGDHNKTFWLQEVRILKMLRNAHILEFVENFYDDNMYYVVTGLCEGGELFDRVSEGVFSEKVASRLARDMVSAVAFCHSKNVTHRDIKPENFVFETTAEDSPMKLIDFGCALKVEDDEIIDTVTGSPYYYAPDLLEEECIRTGKTWKAADMWSVGVIIFLFVTGYPPFNGASHMQIYKRILSGKFEFPKKINLSSSVKELITRLLEMDSAKRMTAAEALQHPWIEGLTAREEVFDISLVKNLNNFRTKCRLKKAVGKALMKKMTKAEKNELKLAFAKFDVNKDGMLGVEEIQKMVKYIGTQDDDPDGVKLMKAMDVDGDGAISIDEFAYHTTLSGLSQNEQKIKQSFDLFDQDGDGFVTKEEIESVCDFLTPAQVKELFKDVDKNGDNRITFEEWIEGMNEKDERKPKPTSGETGGGQGGGGGGVTAKGVGGGVATGPIKEEEATTTTTTTTTDSKTKEV